jgi:hypothetical protein
LGVHALREPTEPEWKKEHMRPQVAHAPIFSIELDHAFPVNGLFGVYVRGVQEPALDLDNLALPTDKKD